MASGKVLKLKKLLFNGTLNQLIIVSVCSK